MPEMCIENIYQTKREFRFILYGNKSEMKHKNVKLLIIILLMSPDVKESY